MIIETLLESSVKYLDVIPGLDLDKKYVCSPLGYVYRVRNKKGKNLELVPMAPFMTRDGYLEYVLTNKYGVKKHIQGQRIIAYCYLPIEKGKDYVNHKNLIRSDNKVENLEWVSQSENVKHSYDTNKDRGRRSSVNISSGNDYFK